MKTSIKYYTKNIFTAAAYYYLVIILIYVILVSLELFGSNVEVMYATSKISFVGFSTMIFLFVSGLNSFKANYYMLAQNGRSRTEAILSFSLSIPMVALALSIFDALCALAVASLLGREIITGFSVGNIFLQNTIWGFVTYLQAAILGYFISLAYYRMNKIMKVLVSVGASAFFIYGIPLLSQAISKQPFESAIELYFNRIFGDAAITHPLQYLLIGILLAAIVSGLSFLLIRRVQIKD